MENIHLRAFEDAIHHKHDLLRSLAADGKKIIGYFCTYAPVEVIHAAGCIPVRVTGGTDRVFKADAHVPSFICPYLRKALESGLHGHMDYLSGIVQGYTCDAACGMMNIWEENIGGELFHTLPLPYNDTIDSRNYFSSALNELCEKLQTIDGRSIGGDAIHASVELFESIRTIMMGLYKKRYNGRLPLTGSEFLTVIHAGHWLPPEQYLEMLRQLESDIRDSDIKPSGGIPVFVSGSLIEDPKYIDLIIQSGCRIVGDDLCTGLRQFDQPELISDDPMERIIERHFARLPCPARSRAIDRAQLLKELARISGARGIIFLFQKFCTPHLADYPVIKDALEKDGVQSILLEMDEAGEMEGQFQTRLESFFEVLEGIEWKRPPNQRSG